MPIFQYSGQDAQGQAVSGVAHGESLDAVAQRLSSQGVTVLQLGLAPGTVGAESVPPAVQPVFEVPKPPPTEARSTFETRVAGQVVNAVPLQALQFMFRQLGTLLNAGINPADALETLSRQSNNGKLASILRETKEHVIAGRPISAGFQRYPEVFNPLMMSMLRVGEEGGFLAEQCNQLSEYIQRDVELRNMIRRETAMPKLTVLFSIIIVLGGNGLIQVLAPGGAGLPVPWLIWLVAAVVGVGAWLFVKFALPQPHIRQRFDETVLTIPGVGGMVHGFAMAKFGRAFGALYKGGVDLPRAVVLAADASGNEAVRSRVAPISNQLKEGRGVTDTFASSGAFSPLVIDMTRTGETTGNMDEMLVKVSEYYEDEGQTKAQMAAKIIGIVCLLFVAAYVLYILVTFYTGYFGRMMSGA